MCRTDDRKELNINRGGILYSPAPYRKTIYTYCTYIFIYIALDYIIYAIPIGRTAVRRIVVLGEHKYNIHTCVHT